MMNSKIQGQTLSLQTIDYPFETLISRAKATPPKLILDPEFQRKYKWDNDGWARASKFIESCLMRIPLPSCYFAENSDGSHLVIDGVQRITTILRFMNDEFALEDLTSFNELEGMKFSELGSLRSAIETTTIRCIILRSENPKDLITEIFARLNQGAVKLSDQEIRHALFPGKFDKLLQKLAEIDVIRGFGIGKSGTSKRDAREGDELVLRFFAFMEDGDSYEGNLSRFLDGFMKKATSFDDKKLIELENSFNKSLEACLIIFEKNDVFSDIGKKKRRQGVVYYDLLMNTLGKIEAKTLIEKRDNVRSAFKELCDSEAFKRLTAGGLQRKSSVNQRNNEWSRRLREALA